MKKYLHLCIAIGLFGVFLASYADLLSHILYYNEQHMLFLYTADYWQSHSFGDWLTAFVVQFFYNPLAGAALMAALLTAIYLMGHRVLTSLTRRDDWLRLALLPPLAVWIWTATLRHTLTPVVWTFIGFAVLTAVSPLWSCRRKTAQLSAQPEKTPLRPSFLSGRKYTVATVAMLAVYAVAAGYSFLRTFSISEYRMIKAQQAVDCHDWDAALHHTERYLATQQQANPLIFYLHTLALYNKGQLMDRLFDYQPTVGVNALYFPWQSRTRETEFGHYLLEQLGCINDAQHWEFEAMVAWGETAPRLTNLARYAIINGRKAIARKYIARLRQSLFYRAEADRLEASVESRHIEGLRAFSTREPDKANFVNVMNLGPNLQYVLSQDPTNRMAYEYLVCDLMLSNNLERLVEWLPMYRRFYQQMPRIMDEALLVCQLGGIDTRGLQPSAETQGRFEQYARLAQSGNMAALQAQFGNTYWFYINYVSPYGNKLKSPSPSQSKKTTIDT